MKEIIILLCIIFLISIYLFKEQSESVDLFGGLNGLDGLANSQTDNTPNIKLINNFVQKNPGASLFYVRDSADFMLTTNTWVFLYDPYNPSNPYGSTLANLDGSRIFGNNMIFQVELIDLTVQNSQIKPIELIVQNSQTYTKSFYRLNVTDINGQDLFINFIVNLIQVQLSNPGFTLDNTPISSIKLKLGDIKLTNLVSVPQTQIKECFSGYSDLIGSAMTTGSTGLERPTKDSGLPDLDDFLNIFPGAQAYYISKSFSPSVLSSNTIVYLFNPSNPSDTNGTQLATGNGTPFFNGEYPLILNVNQDKTVYGPDILSDQYTENINTYIKDRYTLFDVIPYYETIPIQMFKFSILARKVPNGTWIN
jgi:hypothetical protein